MTHASDYGWFARCARLTALGAVLSTALSATVLSAQVQYDTTLYHAMQWRNIGPFRGGRSVAVAGVTSQPLVYYFGGTGGGVWKTDDAGETWNNVSDGFFRTGSVGAIAVAESDPNVVYVGMGEHAVRGVTTSHGDGVYKSTDAGKTWVHIGLERTRAVSRIRIHPENPDLVYVAAQGAPHGPTEDRGIYRSKDGGATWERVLYVSETAGASELSMDPTNPRILYAAFWDHLRRPWVVRSGGPGSGIYKSRDGGDSWEKLVKGLPDIMGKIGVAVSPANPDRVWAIVEAEDAGLFRSDDAGKSWKLLNSERVLRARAWYYIEVFADPEDEETVYVLNARVMKSVDGGRTFAEVSTPHGDNHDLWINPTNNQVMINGNDGGANISFNTGKTWSTQQNQPTAQFYRVNTDNRFPYYVYGGQQDNSTVAIASRTTDAGIDWKDWHPVSGCETAYLAFDPDDPVLVYGGCYQGQISEWDARTKNVRPVMAYPFLGLAMEPKDMRYRFNWNAPIVASPHDPRVIYHAGNVLLKTEDRGFTWTEISPDLTRDEKEKQGPGGEPFTKEGAGGEVYNTIMYVVESPHEAGTIWVGTDDGLVQLTRNGGQSWNNVTPGDIGAAMVNAIEVSPHDPATAYIAVTRYKFNDFTPHIFRTDNYGRSWKRIVRGIGEEAWVRVVREDPVRRGLLYAGTETGMYVSFDEGEHWQSLQLNLPVVPITDLKIQDSDLVASTQGRAFWILGDLSVLRQLNDQVASSQAYLFKPDRAYRVSGGSASRPRLGKNPPNGAVIYYFFAQAPDTDVTLEILNGQGEVIRSSTSDTTRQDPDTTVKPIRARAGLNRFVWNLRHESAPSIEGLFVYGSLRGWRAMPGPYTARLSVGGWSMSQTFEVMPDPRFSQVASGYQQQEEILASIGSQLMEIHGSVERLRAVREQLENLMTRFDDHEAGEVIRAAGQSLVDSLTAVEELLVQPRQKTSQDVINFPNRLNAEFIYLQNAVDGMEPQTTAGARERLAALSQAWIVHKAMLNRVLGDQLEAFNALCREQGIPAVMTPVNE